MAKKKKTNQLKMDSGQYGFSSIEDFLKLIQQEVDYSELKIILNNNDN